ncbi:MAG: trypsin-like peptidase domain-containing protein [Pyrinomonadaceae bacterium]
MERMVIKHTSGSKANQVEEFPLNHYSELILGRETGSTVQYDPDRDDLVGRQHAKISREADDFMIEDTGSRNGTYLNGVRLSERRKLNPGDHVQLGTGGPEFTFEVEPRPEGATKATRISDVATSSAPATRIADSTSVVTAAAATGKPSVGKATVERMIGSSVAETKKDQARKYGAFAAVAAVLVLILFGAVIAGGYWWSARQQGTLQAEIANKSQQLEDRTSELKTKMDQGGISASEISDKYQSAVVFIQGSWQLVNQESKTPVYHQFMPNSREALSAMYKQNFGKGPIIPNGGNAIPLYVKTEDSYEPVLTDVRNNLSYPMGAGGYSCSGFLVTTDGFILTNRHCSSPWKSQYSFPGNYPLGIVFGSDGSIAGAGIEPPEDWIPDNTKSVGRQYQGKFEAQQKLTVMLPGSDTPIEARKIQDSPRHDVGMLQISVPGNLPKVELYDASETLKKGEGLVIMGYPGGAPGVYAAVKSENFLNTENKYTVIPDPTVSTTSVGNIVKNVESSDSTKVRMSEMGDSVRYAQSLTWGGNSGGPVFDMQGRVIGIHFAGTRGAGGPSAGIAVPIKYGLQLFPGGAPK